MARARNIKPSFFINEELVELPFSTRLLFIGLWTFADRDGRLEDKPKKIKMSLFPADNLDINQALDELQKSGFIVRYSIDNNQYIQILAFKKHQNPHKDEKPSSIPECKEHHTSTVQAPCKNDVNTVAIGLIPDSFNLVTDCLSVCSAENEENPKTHAEIQISEIAKSLTEIGMMPFNLSLPKFKALIEAGATVQEFVSTALERKGTEKFTFSYLLTTMTNRRQEAMQAKPLHKGAMPAYKTPYQAQREKDRDEFVGGGKVELTVIGANYAGIG